MAVAAARTGSLTATPDSIREAWRARISQAKAARKPHEKVWLSNLAFASGRHWLVWDESANQMRHIQEVDQGQRNRVLYTADRITEYLRAQLGELNQDDDRPELVTVQDSDTAEQAARHLNQAVGHGWDHEWKAQDALLRARSFCLTMGVAAVRMQFDPGTGPVTDHQPVGPDGKPLQEPGVLAHLEQAGTLPDGSLPKFQPVHEGRSVLRPLTAFQLLTPPGVVHEDDFPWEIVVRPVHLDDVFDEYPHLKGVVTEDTDIASASGMTTGQSASGTRTGGNDARLRDHVWLYTCFRRPCRQYPDGQKVVLVSNNYELAEAAEQLPYIDAAGDRSSGVVYLHWWRLDDRFWSRAFIEPLKDPQRLINERESQNAEIIARGMPKAFTKKGSLPERPQGLPMENIEFDDLSTIPIFHDGVGPGAWMYEDLAHHADNLAHASTISALRLGENPQNVDTYSQLALLNENEQTKRSTIRSDHQRQIARLVEFGVHDIREWWPDRKQILVSGDEGQISRQIFQKAQIPDFYMVKVPVGATQPRSQGAELKKVDVVWNAAVASRIVEQDPEAWTRWYNDSLNAGASLELPEAPKDSQVELAQYENFLMVEQGQVPVPAPHDLMPVHVPAHREALDHARASGDMEAAQRIQQHIELSVQAAVTARKAWRFVDPTDTNDLASDLALDEDQALRENEMILAGHPLNQEEFRKALTSLQQRVNPETGQPVQPTDDLHGILERAALKPTMVENLQLHMDRHGKVIKSAEFERFPDDVRRRFQTHFDLTRELWLSIPMMPEKIESPKVSLQLRESVGPSTIATVLHRAGVPDADPGVLASEEPMANMVQEDITAPAPAAGAPTSEQGAAQ